jgi:CheY-like chemotaxis protein
MPHKSGIECLAEIRQDQRLQHIPVVIYSTSSSLKDINDTFDKGANLYVKKPNSFSELRLITAKVLALNWNKYKPYFSRSQFLFSSKTE